MDRDDESTPRVVRAFVEAVPTPALACDLGSHAIRAANAPAAALLGQDRGTLTLMGLTDLGETDETVDGEPVAAAVDEAIDREGVTEFEWETGGERGRRRLSVSLHATTIADERWLIVGLTDVTDRVTAEEDLRSQLRVVEAVASTVPAALFQCSADGTLARWNDRLAAAAERGGEELSGTDLTALFDDETRDAVAEALRRVYREREPADCEATLLTRSGERVPYRLALGPIVEGDKVVGAVGVGEDRTEASIREERLAVLTRVLRHNFRNDLNVVTGFTERAIETVEDPELATELERVVDTAERLLRVGETSRRVERLLADRPAPTRLDLADAVDEALGSLPPELREGADIEVDVPEGIAVSAIGYLAEAIAELVDNAIRHSHAERPRVEITAAELPSESWASLVVADDGPGIPPAERAVLTGEETPLEHASGLGLWYVNWIVSAGGGSFDISSASTGGTRIEMELRTPAGE
ncbi:sensor histidine kinase [Halorubrum halophilum]|uniref:sensor histidine kinase n=1 Tax=Halorubrum halophilum TaxID=413816 RepID=UPI000678EB51|nr:PAS domain-containing sensor histidine kinase [Halorubrum halophilum]